MISYYTEEEFQALEQEKEALEQKVFMLEQQIARDRQGYVYDYLHHFWDSHRDKDARLWKKKIQEDYLAFRKQLFGS